MSRATSTTGRLVVAARALSLATGSLGCPPGAERRGNGRSSTDAKKTEAALRISLARRSSATSRLSRLISADSSVVVPPGLQPRPRSHRGDKRSPYSDPTREVAVTPGSSGPDLRKPASRSGHLPRHRSTGGGRCGSRCVRAGGAASRARSRSSPGDHRRSATAADPSCPRGWPARRPRALARASRTPSSWAGAGEGSCRAVGERGLRGRLGPTRFSARTGSSPRHSPAVPSSMSRTSSRVDRGDVRKFESSVTKREECVGSSGLGVSKRSSVVDADLRRIALSRHAPRGCLVLELGNAGREDEPSPPVRPWPAGVAVYSVYSW
jgi:hypothetical protein